MHSEAGRFQTEIYLLSQDLWALYYLIYKEWQIEKIIYS